MVIRNFAKFTGKHLCQVLFFNKVADPELATLLKNRLWRRCFSMNFAKFLRAPFSQNIFGRLLLDNKALPSWESKESTKWTATGPGLVPRWLSCFKVLHYDHLLLCRANAAWDVQWRYREKRNDQGHHEEVSFFHLAKFWMFFFCFLENVLFNSNVACYVTCSCRKTFKQPFTDVLQKRCSKKFCNIHRKKPVLKPLFDKVSGLKACIFI